MRTPAEINKEAILSLRKRVAKQYAIGMMSETDMQNIMQNCDDIVDILDNPQEDEDAASGHQAAS
jgi:hypothetical protein